MSKKWVLDKNCPFCNIKDQEHPVLFYKDGKEVPFKEGDTFPKKWTTVVLPNKHPAFVPSNKLNRKRCDGLFETTNAVGYHEVIVTNNHDKSLALLSREHIKEVIDVYAQRYIDLIKKKTVNYVSIFHNHGPEAGASVYHPHSQLIAIPLIDIDLEGALSKARKFQKTKCSSHRT